MAKDGKNKVSPEELDLEHELTEGNGLEDDTESYASGTQPAAGGEVQKLKQERDLLVERLARMQADFENARKRAAREQQEYREYAVADAVKALLPTLDSFERALQSAPPEAAEFRSGVELIYKQLLDTLARLGVTAIPATGEAFDPRFHQAIEMVETRDVPDHQVIEELQRGYKLKDRLLRPAMVKVARNS